MMMRTDLGSLGRNRSELPRGCSLARDNVAIAPRLKKQLLLGALARSRVLANIVDAFIRPGTLPGSLWINEEKQWR
jgi:hypothetical protein